MPEGQLLNEITALRTERNKTFNLSNGKKRLVCHCKPIHYEKSGRGDWQDINLDFREEVDKFITDENKVSIGFRKDKKFFKYFGARYDYEHQFEATIKEIKLDGIEQVKSDQVTSLARNSETEISHQINSNIEIINQINEVSLKNFIKVSSPIGNFKIVEELYLKGLTCSNKKESNNYILDKYGRFNFIDEKGKLKFWINKPFFKDNEGKYYQSLTHTLQEIDGKLIYTKTPTKEGQDDLILALYPVLIDTNTYYSSTADGIIKYDASDTWANVRGATTGDSAISNIHQDQQSMSSFYQSKTTTYGIGRSFFYFDTSDLPDGATVTVAVLKLRGYAANSSDVSAQQGTQADTLTTADYNNYSGSEYGHTSWVTTGYNSITFNATGKSDISLTGTTKVCCREYTHDYSDSVPTTTYNNGCYYSDEELTTKDPKLEIDYTEGGGAVVQDIIGNNGIIPFER